MDSFMGGAIFGTLMQGAETSRERLRAIRARDRASSAEFDAAVHRGSAAGHARVTADLMADLKEANEEIFRLQGRVARLQRENHQMLVGLQAILKDGSLPGLPGRLHVTDGNQSA